MTVAVRPDPDRRASGAQRGETDLDSARRVLAAETEGLRALAGALDSGFVRALDLLSGATGRVIVTGMGKSGHVARKIAATLASTGTPALFVHPAEASHGDLGMVVADDAILALSNSGETAELGDLIAHAKRFGLGLVAVVGRADSTLAEAADVALVLPQVAEACPMGLAPTTSTTMMLALGDALAVALLERKRFTSAHFHALHPGGRLGQRLLKVADIMHSGDRVPTVPPDAPMSDVLIEMTAKSFGCAAVVDSAGTLLGVVTDGDLRRHMNAGLLGQRAREVMTLRPKTIAPGAFAAEALRLMNESAITGLFAVEAGKLAGIVHVHDCLRAGVA